MASGGKKGLFIVINQGQWICLALIVIVFFLYLDVANLDVTTKRDCRFEMCETQAQLFNNGLIIAVH